MSNEKETKQEEVKAPVDTAKRIAELEKEVAEFQTKIQSHQAMAQQIQNEIIQLAQGIQTRQGGIIELKKL